MVQIERADDDAAALAATVSSRAGLIYAIRHHVVPAFALAVTYFLGAILAFGIGTFSDRVFAPFWPPNVILFAALFFTPPRRWPVLLVAVLPAHVAAEALVGMPPVQMAVAFAANSLIAIASAAAIRRLLGTTAPFTGLRAIVTYLTVVIAVAALGAIAGAFMQITGGGAVSAFPAFWLDWFAANAVGFLLLGPLLLIWLEPGAPTTVSLNLLRTPDAQLVAFGLVVSSLLSSSVASIEPASGWIAGIAYLYLPLPFKLWATVRYGQSGATAAVMIVALITIWAAMNISTFFVADRIEDTVRAVQFFLFVDAATLLVLGAAIDQLRITERHNSQMARHLIDVADEERRRIARELHDHTGQQLYAAALILDRLAPLAPADATQQPLAQVRHILRDSMREIRTFSYSLHPPLLDEGGLRLAIDNYVAGYVERAGITVVIDFPEDIGAIPSDIELGLFRVVQEALANISRHSGATFARISLEPANGGVLALTVEDNGRGIPWLTGTVTIDGTSASRFAQGFGLRSIAARVAQLLGRTEISSRPGRTALRVTIPAT